ncbi:hypothetical protein Q7P37_001236 [Cladosporium fusiforme]
MLLLLPFLLGKALAQSNPTTTHTVTVLDDNPDQRTLNPMSSLGPDETYTILTLKPSGTDEHSQTKWVETTGLTAETTVTSQFSFSTTTSPTIAPSGTATHSISWQHGHHMEVVTVTGPDGKPSAVTRADLLSTHVTVEASTKDDGTTVLVPVDRTETTTVTEHLTRLPSNKTDTATVTATFTRSPGHDIETATITTMLDGSPKITLPHKEGAAAHYAPSSKCHPHPWRKNAFRTCMSNNCMAAFQRPINYSTVHAYPVFNQLYNITYSTSVTTPHWGKTLGGKHIYTEDAGVSCKDERGCQDTCAIAGRKAVKTLMVFTIIIPLLIFLLALLCCCCVPLVWLKKRRTGRAYGNSNKALTEGSETSGGNSIARVSNDPVGTVTEEVVAGGGAAGAAGRGNENTASSDSRTVTSGPAAADSTATITDTSGGRAGTMRRAAEEGRAPQRVRFGENPSNAAETVTTTTTQVDGPAEVRTGSEVFDVGSMRGRKRNRGDELVV